MIGHDRAAGRTAWCHKRGLLWGMARISEAGGHEAAWFTESHNRAGPDGLMVKAGAPR